EHTRSPCRRERAEPAGGLEQGGRLQLAAAQVALDGNIRGVRVLALQKLTLGKRGAGVRERAQLCGAGVSRQLREGEREQEVTGCHRRLAPPDGGHRGPAPSQT